MPPASAPSGPAEPPALGNDPSLAGPFDPNMIPSPPTPAAERSAYAFAGAALALNIISFLLFSARIATRTIPVFQMGCDDWIICAAYAFLLGNSVLLMKTVPYTFGGDPSTFTLQDVINGNKYAVLSQPLWAFSMATIKISVAAMMLRLEQRRRWRQFLWFMIVILVLICIYNTIAFAIQCFPLEAAWDIADLITDKKCWSVDAIRVSSTAVSVFNIVTDVIFALMPATFLSNVQIPMRERIVIGILMGLGIFASAASIVKAVALAEFGKTDDPNGQGIIVGTWFCIEQQVAFIAACIPCLRKPFQIFLQKVGLLSTVGHTSNKATAGTGFRRMYGKQTSEATGGTIKMKSMMSRDAPSEESILASNSANGQDENLKPGEIWRTTEVYLNDEPADWEDSKNKNLKGPVHGV
ncbi:hypothetical protein B0T21DRAFT_379096 [Apiosordaria backusii]|uniref:Rhodopsin domain-containing protein n=1 Tax=Apiosordaria backusii TaxID=314023 RepID=A0AA39ZPS8_9PEZI|nr:hypothetical protein B0T21DRAFT_379096 [Apiosordaria backusii]